MPNNRKITFQITDNKFIYCKSVSYYRDKKELECDAVIHLRDGRYGLIEIKLGGESLIEDGAKTLNQLENQIDTTRMKTPAFKMVLTATGKHAYRRKEDVCM